VTQNGDYTFGFMNNPNDIGNLNVNFVINNYLTQYSGKPLYIYSDNSEAESEIYINFYKVAERIQKACYSGLNCTEDVPVKTCENNLIILQYSNNIKIEQKENCLFISAPEENILLATDKALFRIFGIE
jgi:hypothetical protein